MIGSKDDSPGHQKPECLTLMPTVMPAVVELASLKCALLRKVNFIESIIPEGQLVGTLCWLAPESLTVNRMTESL